MLEPGAVNSTEPWAEWGLGTGTWVGDREEERDMERG